MSVSSDSASASARANSASSAVTGAVSRGAADGAATGALEALEGGSCAVAKGWGRTNKTWVVKEKCLLILGCF